jgi:oligopeptide transport system substrate-binding protein
MKKVLLPALTLALIAGTLSGMGCSKKSDAGLKVLNIGAVAVAGSSDPNNLNSMYDLDIANLVYDTFYEYEYFARPFKLKPAMAESMPQVSKDGLTYTIKLKKGIQYVDDQCFANGKGREAVVGDFIYNLYRKADSSTKSTNWWLVDGVIAGLDELRKEYKGKKFDYTAKIEGLKAIDDHTLQIKLKKPFPQIMWILAMAGMSLYPAECVAHYGEDFANNPVGTGPFRLTKWQKNARYTLVRNPKYREDYYPTEGEAKDKAAGHLKDAGKRIPFADKVIVHEFTQTQPYWLQFRAGKFAWGRVPAEATSEVFEVAKKEGNRKFWKRDANGVRVLSPDWDKKYTFYPLPLLDFIYRGFNYEDPIVGGDKGRKLRQALSVAHDIDEANDLFYNGLNIIYSGIIPPGVGGFDPNKKNPYRGPDLERAKKLLAEAGYPGGKGLPELQLCGSESTSAENIAVQFITRVKKIGVNVRLEKSRFAELSKKLKEKRCQMMGLAWGGDWPDAQNFIQLMYGPNASPGSNNVNFNHPKVNALYRKASVMGDGPARNKIYQQINDIVLEEVPFIGAMARTRDYLIPHDTLNFKPEEMFHNHAKFLRMKSWGE